MLNDGMIRRKLELQNFKAVQLPGGIGYANPGRGLPAIPPEVKRILDMSTGKIRGRKKLLEGEQVYKLRKPLEEGDEQIQYIIAKESDFKEIPASVLEYRPGYVPRVRENIHYVGELIGKSMLDGNIVENSRKTVRFFDNPKDVETWLKDMRSKGAAVDVKSSNQWFAENPQRIDNWEEQAFGGVFEGKRTDGQIPFNLTGTEAERMGGIEALEAYMNHLSNRMPATEFRIALVRRFVNSAVDPTTGKSVLNKSGDWRDPLNIDKTASVYPALKAMQDWVKAQLSVPTTEERIWNQVAHNFARWVSKSPIPMGDRVSAGIVKAGTADLSGLAKTAAFHTTLGFLNPSQFIVQGMGAATAFALDPLNAPRYMSKYLAMRAALSTAKRSPVLEVRAAKAAGEDVTEFQEMMSAYYRTGLHQSVESVGDYGMATGMYASKASIGYLADKGLVFFREGERFVRGYAWIQAWSKLYKKGTPITDDFINQVTNESVRYTLDLNRANKAYWQSGLLGIPTQFMQITTKFIENYLYKGSRLEAGWTAQEKARIATANIALFGAAGIPFGDSMLNSALNWIKDEGDYGLAIKDEALATVLAGGLVEYSIYHATGEHIALSERVSIPNGLESFFEDKFSEDATALEIAAGVFGEVPKRAYQALGNITHVYAAILFEDGPMDHRVLLENVEEIANITSGFRNGRKAYLWNQSNAILNSKGEALVPLDERNVFAITLAQGMGFGPKDQDNFYKLRKFNQESERDNQDAADAWVQLVNRYSNEAMLQTKSGSERAAAMARILVQGLTPAQKQEVAKRVSRALTKDDYKLTRELIQASENVQNREGDLGNLETNTLLFPENE
jgi:hypothetical protein